MELVDLRGQLEATQKEVHNLWACLQPFLQQQQQQQQQLQQHQHQHQHGQPQTEHEESSQHEEGEVGSSSVVSPPPPLLCLLREETKSPDTVTLVVPSSEPATPTSPAPSQSSSSHSADGFESARAYLAEEFGFADNLSEEEEAQENSGDSFDSVFQSLQVFVLAPLELEKMVIMCWLVCLDAFLFVLTIFPWKVVASCSAALSGRWSNEKRNFVVHGVMLLGNLLIMSQFSYQTVYHLLETQSILKTAMLLKFFKLASSLLFTFGRDLTDVAQVTLYRGRVGFYLVVMLPGTILYLFCHTMCFYTELVLYNMAINSHYTALLTMLVSLNFTELKTTLRRSLPKSMFVEIVWDDVIKRFYLSVFGVALFLYCQIHQTESSGIFFIIGAEMVVDWLKHSFLSQRNNVSAEDYQAIRHDLFCHLAQRKVRCHPLFVVLPSARYLFRRGGNPKDRSFITFSVASAKLGFAPVPLACVCLHYGHHVMQYYFPEYGLWSPAILLLLALPLKLLLKYVLIQYATSKVCWVPGGEGSVIKMMMQGTPSRTPGAESRFQQQKDPLPLQGCDRKPHGGSRKTPGLPPSLRFSSAPSIHHEHTDAPYWRDQKRQQALEGVRARLTFSKEEEESEK